MVQPQLKGLVTLATLSLAVWPSSADSSHEHYALQHDHISDLRDKQYLWQNFNSTVGSTTESTTEIPSFTELPTYTAPTQTLTGGPEETSEAAKAAPILWYLWQRRADLQDEAKKQEYIDDVEESRDEFVALFNQFSVKPPPKPECQQTALKRSLISGILDTFASAAELLSCGVEVLNNLVDTVQALDPPIPTIEILTDTLKDIADELEKQDDEPTSTTTATTSSTSCTQTITETWESVFCTVTASLSANGKRQDQPCTTLVYSTVTGCSVVGSTVTSTTTTTPTSTPIPQCAFESCGDGSSTCSVKERDLSKRRPDRVTQPDTNTWAGPENYGGNNQDFMAGEVGLAYQSPDNNNQGVILDGGLTSNFVGFYGNPASLAVSGLYGCTSVIAVSKRGAWVSHIWEVPLFTHRWDDQNPPTDLEQRDIFQNQVLTPLHAGTSVNHVFGLAQMRDPSAGDDQPISHYLEDDADPHVFIFAPYKRGEFGTPNYNNEFPTGLPEAWGQDDGLPSKNQQIENEIKAIFSAQNGLHVPYEKVLYAPRQWADPLVQEDIGDSNYDNHRGKVLVQYQPAKSCREKASWRIWFEGHELQGSHQAEWEPLGTFQVVQNPAVKGRQERPTTTEPPTTSEEPTITTTEEPPTTTEEPATPTTPLERSEIVCHNEADFPGHADISSSAQDDFSTDFSGLRGPGGSDDLGPDTGGITLSLQDGHGINYWYGVFWVQGCVTETATQNFRFPLGSPSSITAYLLMRENYTKCNNGGVGGKVQVGCLEYTFTGGE
ncbi:hypothetical protein DL771_003507 [Monosporascus sp. 5C6A]|nr:hypothetical protein DL771_003507 [Monosporascus sp. 5C6A]